MTIRGLCTVLAVTSVAAVLSSPPEAQSRPALLQDQRACRHGVVRLPLPDGMSTGSVGGGRGERILLGGEVPGPRGAAPLLWRRTGCRSWRGGVTEGDTTGEGGGGGMGRYRGGSTH